MTKSKLARIQANELLNSTRVDLSIDGGTATFDANGSWNTTLSSQLSTLQQNRDIAQQMHYTPQQYVNAHRTSTYPVAQIAETIDFEFADDTQIKSVAVHEDEILATMLREQDRIVADNLCVQHNDTTSNTTLWKPWDNNNAQFQLNANAELEALKQQSLANEFFNFELAALPEPDCGSE